MNFFSHDPLEAIANALCGTMHGLPVSEIEPVPVQGTVDNA